MSTFSKFSCSTVCGSVLMTLQTFFNSLSRRQSSPVKQHTMSEVMLHLQFFMKCDNDATKEKYSQCTPIAVHRFYNKISKSQALFGVKDLQPGIKIFEMPLFCHHCSGLIVPEQYGNETVPEVVSQSGYALLHFFSDAAYNLTGFNISYR